MKRKSHPLLCLFLVAACCGAHAQAPTFNPFMDQGRYTATVLAYPTGLPPLLIAPPDIVNTHFPSPLGNIYLNYRHQDSLQSHLAWRWLQLKYYSIPAAPAGALPSQLQYTTRIATSDGPAPWRLTLAIDRQDTAFFATPPVANIVTVTVAVTKLNGPPVVIPNVTVNFTNPAPATPTTPAIPAVFSNTLPPLDPNSIYDVVITIAPPAAPATLNPYNHLFDMIITTP